VVNLFVTNNITVSFLKKEGNTYFDAEVLASKYPIIPVGTIIPIFEPNWDFSYTLYNVDLSIPEKKKEPVVFLEEKMPWE